MACLVTRQVLDSCPPQVLQEKSLHCRYVKAPLPGKTESDLTLTKVNDQINCFTIISTSSWHNVGLLAQHAKISQSSKSVEDFSSFPRNVKVRVQMIALLDKRPEFLRTSKRDVHGVNAAEQKSWTH